MLYVSVIIDTYINISIYQYTENGRLFTVTDKNGRIESD
jgi:hypothetical protein